MKTLRSRWKEEGSRWKEEGSRWKEEGSMGRRRGEEGWIVIKHVAGKERITPQMRGEGSIDGSR